MNITVYKKKVASYVVKGIISLDCFDTGKKENDCFIWLDL